MVHVTAALTFTALIERTVG